MEQKIIMLPVRQKQIVDSIIQAGFKIDDIEFMAFSELRFELYYKKNKFYCLKIDQTNNFKAIPGSNGNPHYHGKIENWKHCLKIVETWIKYLSENVEIGNPWEEIENAKNEMSKIKLYSYLEIFENEDQAKIEHKLDTLLLEFEKLNIDTSIIKEDINHLKTMSGKISKKDWILLFMGNLTSWIFTSLIPTEHTASIWEMIKVLFSDLKSKLLS